MGNVFSIEFNKAENKLSNFKWIFPKDVDFMFTLEYDNAKKIIYSGGGKGIIRSASLLTGKK